MFERVPGVEKGKRPQMQIKGEVFLEFVGDVSFYIVPSKSFLEDQKSDTPGRELYIHESENGDTE